MVTTTCYSANKLGYVELTNLAETFFQVNVKAAFELEMQTSCPVRININPQASHARESVFEQLETDCCCGNGTALPSLSANGVSLLTRKSGLLLSYSFFTLKVSPLGDGGARLVY